MILTKTDLKKIEQVYEIGKFKSIKMIDEGLVNYNYFLNTSKGKFVIRILGKKADEFKLKKMEVEFSVLEYLKSHNFEYKVPSPLKSLNGEYILKLKDKDLFVYPKIEGELIGDRRIPTLKKVARALADYHICISNFNKKSYSSFSNNQWILKHFQEMKRVKPKNDLDRVMLNNVDYVYNLLKKFDKINGGKDFTYIHNDFAKHNLLKNKRGQIIAILDFDNIDYAPRAYDVAKSIQMICLYKDFYDKKKEKIFLDEYEKIYPLSKKDKSLLYTYMIKNKTILFWWHYSHMEKKPEYKLNALKFTVRDIKLLEKMWRGK